ncbi:MAG: hypothetical protein RH860_14840 [Cytophagales bacterium]
MDLNQLVHASEILENLKSIEDAIQIKGKTLSKDGRARINEIMADCYQALSKSCDCDDRGRKEFIRINALILESCLNIKAMVESKSGFSEIMA